ncbi:GTPase IMAP family member 4-like, partial [Clarias gariepinus]
MAGEVLPMAPGGPPPLSERRIVLLGKAGAGKHRVVRVILGDTKPNEECEECFVYEGEQAGRRIRIVDTPGWDRISKECTSPKIKNEITRSVTLCAPGPHALILVLPINTDDVPSVNELKSACQHMELLSERVWNYTMVLFLCDGDVKESRVNDHIQSAEKLLEKCSGKHYVMRQRSFKTELHEFLKEIDSMVGENIRDSKVKESGGFLLPQVHYDTMPHKEDPQKNTDKSLGEDKSEGKDMLRQRRGSLQLTHPNMTKQTEDSKSPRDGTEAPKSKNQDQLQYIKPVAVIV